MANQSREPGNRVEVNTIHPSALIRPETFMNIRQYHRTDPLQRAQQCLFAVLFVMGCVTFSRPASAQDAPLKIWEFAPYEVEVWCSLDPDLNVSETAQSQFIKALGDDLDRAFQSAWRTRVIPVDSEQRSRIARHLDVIKLDDFTREELVLVVNRDPANASCERWTRPWRK